MEPNLNEIELVNLQKQLHEELLLVRKFRQFGDLSSNPELGSLCLQIARMHQEHYNIPLQTLINIK